MRITEAQGGIFYTFEGFFFLKGSRAAWMTNSMNLL